jgi:hypothetical protein
MPDSINKDFFKSINIIYFALLGGQIMFLAVVFIIAKDVIMTKELKAMSNLFIIVVPVFAFGGLAAGRFMFRNMLNKVDKKESLYEKLKKYRTALILKFALHEGPVLFSIVFYLLTQNQFFLGIAAILIMFFLFIRPTKEKIIQDLELNSSEGNML